MSQLNSWLSSRLQSSDRSYWKRCWRGSVNGWHTQTFHQLCDDLGPTVTIVRAYGYIYGGYTDRSWKCTYHYSITFFNFSVQFMVIIRVSCRQGGFCARPSERAKIVQTYKIVFFSFDHKARKILLV